MTELEKKLRTLFGVGIVVVFTLLGLGWFFAPPMSAEALKALSEYSSPAGRLDHRWFNFSFWGLAALVAVPFLRVLLSAYFFKKSGETKLAAMSALVFLGLALGLWVGVASGPGN